MKSKYFIIGLTLTLLSISLLSTASIINASAPDPPNYRPMFIAETGSSDLSYLAMSDNAEFIAVAEYDPTPSSDVMVYDTSPSGAYSNTPLYTKTVPGPYSSLAVSADGSTLVVGTSSTNNTLYCYDAPTGNLLWSFLAPVSMPWSALDVSRDGSIIIAGGELLYRFNRSSNIPQWTFNVSEVLSGYANDLRLAENADYFVVNLLEYSPSGKESITLFSKSTGNLLWYYRVAGRPFANGISADGSLIAGGGSGNILYVFGIADNTTTYTKALSGWVMDLAVSSNGKYIAVATDANEGIVYSSSGTELLNKNHESEGYSADLTSDGGLALFATQYGKVYMYDVASGVLKMELNFTMANYYMYAYFDPTDSAFALFSAGSGLLVAYQHQGAAGGGIPGFTLPYLLIPLLVALPLLFRAKNKRIYK